MNKMTILLLSDIHSNNRYLNLILDIFENKKIISKLNVKLDKIINLGDILDRGKDDPKDIINTFKSIKIPQFHIKGNHDLYSKDFDYLSQNKNIELNLEYRKKIRENPEYNDVRVFFDQLRNNIMIKIEEFERKIVAYHGGLIPLGKYNPYQIEYSWQRITPDYHNLVKKIKKENKPNPIKEIINKKEFEDDLVIPSIYGGHYSPIFGFKIAQKILMSNLFIAISGHTHDEYIASWNLLKNKNIFDNYSFQNIKIKGTHHNIRNLQFQKDSSLLISMKSSGGYNSNFGHGVLIELNRDYSKDKVIFIDIKDVIQNSNI